MVNFVQVFMVSGTRVMMNDDLTLEEINKNISRASHWLTARTNHNERGARRSLEYRRLSLFSLFISRDGQEKNEQHPRGHKPFVRSVWSQARK